MIWWIVLIVVLLLASGWVLSRRRQGKERYRPDQTAVNRSRRINEGRW